MRLEASRELLALPADVWALLAEPHHLSDWWPGYTGVRPGRRGLAEGARWQIVRSHAPGLLRQPGGEGMIVITRVEPRRSLAWRDLAQDFEARVTIEGTTAGSTFVALTLEAPWWRIAVEGLRGIPQQALTRLHNLCQTATTL